MRVHLHFIIQRTWLSDFLGACRFTITSKASCDATHAHSHANRVKLQRVHCRLLLSASARTQASSARYNVSGDKGTDSPPRQIHPERYYGAMATDEDTRAPLQHCSSILLLSHPACDQEEHSSPGGLTGADNAITSNCRGG
ncbi:unnamed protein product [Pleuronectes platessa]|uniref:Uncharacterized protein n=1 Tax=Pleuronectes platessa TaxID=8262 RepID=A0A9N7Z3P1_PLEPL|nr:unnamed protein product [Pleuronectes platessa]